MTEPLSPAAQAILDAAVSHPTFATRKRIAAAFRAVASQMEFVQDVLKLHAIAAELEAQP